MVSTNVVKHLQKGDEETLFKAQHQESQDHDFSLNLAFLGFWFVHLDILEWKITVLKSDKNPVNYLFFMQCPRHLSGKRKRSCHLSGSLSGKYVSNTQSQQSKL